MKALLPRILWVSVACAALGLLFVLGFSALGAPAPICPDIYEPNESFQEAIKIQTREIESYICAYLDKDYFYLDGQAGDTVQLQLDSLPHDYNMCFYGPKGEMLECSSSVGTKPEFIQRVLSASGNHYVYIYGVQGVYSTSDSYILRTSKSRPTSTPSPTSTASATPSVTPSDTPSPTPSNTPNPGCPDPYEPNEKCEDAWPVTEGEYDAYICTDSDEDWFALEVLYDQDASITILGLPANYDLELYNPVGTRLRASNNAGTADDSIDFTASELAGRYCIRVWGVAGAHNPSNTYTLKIGMSDPPGPTPTHTASPTPPPTPTCPPDAFEPNDGQATAAGIAPGEDISAVLCPRGDNDYYAFAVSSCTQIDVTLSDLPDNYSLALIDPSGTTVNRAGGVGTSDRHVTRIASMAGIYIVRVYPGAGADSHLPYTLRVDLAPATPVTLYPIRDATIYAGSAGTNYGGNARLVVGMDELGFRYRSLVRFDLGEIGYDPVTSAHLVLHLHDYSGHDAPGINVRRCISTWSEGSVTWSTLPASVDVGVSATVGSMAGTDFIWDVTDVVQDWVSGASSNYGLELRYADDIPSSWRAFISREGGAGQPRLVVGCASPGGGTTSISGAVYVDRDRDGIRDGSDEGVPDVRIVLIERDFGQVAGTLTSADGSYSFADQPIGADGAVYEVTADETTIDMLDTYEWLNGPVYSVYANPGSVFEDIDLRVALRPTPTPGPTPSIDFSAEDMELVQVLFDEPLVKGKTTMARVYVGLTGDPGPVEVSGRLFHGVESIRPIQPAEVINSAFANPKDDPLVYDNLDRTLNFILPDAWTRADDLHLTAWVNWATPGDECGGCWDSENQFTPHPDPHFRTASSYDVTVVLVTLDGVAPTASRAETVRYMLQTYPINTVNVTNDAVSWTGIDLSDTSGSGCGPEWRELLDELDALEVFGSLGDDSAPDRVYGMVHESTNDPSGWGGCGYRPGTAAAGITTPGTDRGGIIMAHETGHNLGLQHTCCSGEGGCVTHHPGGTLGRMGIDLRDPANPLLIAESVGHDIMTYCANRWQADHTYSYLLEIFTGSPGVESLAADLDVLADHLVAFGTIEQGQVTLSQRYYVLPAQLGAYLGGGEGQYKLELRGDQGQVLDFGAFDAMGDSAEPVSEGDGPFRVILPWHADTTSVAIVDGQTDLLVTMVSAHAPEVTITAPACDSWSSYGFETVTWDASDADENPLEYVVQFSADGGDAWMTVVTGLTEPTCQVDVARLPGTMEGRFRVFASDGVLTGMAVSEACLVVEGKPPEVTIIQPMSGSTCNPGSRVVLRALASDLEDGPSGEEPTEPFLWVSSLDGELGLGAILQTDLLSPGSHTISAEWIDGDGYTGRDEVVLYVGHSLRLPLVRKD